jgi:hypothetical protein
MKKQEDDILDYDDDDAIQFILNNLPEESKENIDEDSIQYVLDVVYDFYEEKGFIDEDSVEEASIDEEEMLKFIVKFAKKDKMSLTEDQIQLILDGEFEYGKSLGIYKDEE